MGEHEEEKTENDWKCEDLAKVHADRGCHLGSLVLVYFLVYGVAPPFLPHVFRPTLVSAIFPPKANS